MNKNDIIITYGNNAKAMTQSLLETIDIYSLIGDKNKTIGLKPNLVVARPSAEGATTTPLIVETIIDYLQKGGFNNICIIESAWIGDSTKRAFKVCGYEDIAKKYGVPLYDVKDDKYEVHSEQGIDIEMSQKVMKLDYLINIPVLKGHCQTMVTCALKNMKGCISDRSKRYFHTIGLHKPIAALNKIKSAQLVIVDSLNGDLDFEEGGNPLSTNRMFAAQDSVLIDAYGAALMGYSANEIPYLQIAQNLGIGSADINSANIIQINEDKKTMFASSSRKVKQLEKYICASSACSACYGNLIHALARLQDKGELGKLNNKSNVLHIGQDYKQKTSGGYGIGACCKGFDKYVNGCPPKALDMLKFLDEI